MKRKTEDAIVGSPSKKQKQSSISGFIKFEASLYLRFEHLCILPWNAITMYIPDHHTYINFTNSSIQDCFYNNDNDCEGFTIFGFHLICPITNLSNKMYLPLSDTPSSHFFFIAMSSNEGVLLLQQFGKQLYAEEVRKQYSYCGFEVAKFELQNFLAKSNHSIPHKMDAPTKANTSIKNTITDVSQTDTTHQLAAATILQHCTPVLSAIEETEQPLLVCGEGRFKLYASDMKRLKPNNWLSDGCINCYMELVLQKKLPSIMVVFSTDIEGAINRSIQQKQTRVPTMGIPLMTKKYWIIPSNSLILANNHWLLFVVCHPAESPWSKNNTHGARVLVFDSYATTVHKKVVDWICEYFRLVCVEEKHSYSKIPVMRVTSLQQQETIDDCGVFMLHYLECIIADPSIIFAPKTMPILDVPAKRSQMETVFLSNM